MKYLFLINAEENAEYGIEPEDILQWFSEVEQRGARLIGSPLEPTAAGKRITLRGGKPFVTDGPFAEAKEVIGGFDVIECASMEDAVEIAALHPVAPHGSIDVRPLVEGGSLPTAGG
jgi:hypothetical protein